MPSAETVGETNALRLGIAPHGLWPDRASEIDDIVETARTAE